MKTFFGILLIAAGVALGLWAGVWWALIGGIVDVINALKAAPIEALPVATGIAKVLFSGLIGWLSFAVVALFGLSLLKD